MLFCIVDVLGNLWLMLCFWALLLYHLLRISAMSNVKEVRIYVPRPFRCGVGVVVSI